MTLYHSRRLQLDCYWCSWMIGVCGPHGGMIVWTFRLGPLCLDFWPRATDVEPF